MSPKKSNLKNSKDKVGARPVSPIFGKAYSFQSSVFNPGITPAATSPPSVAAPPVELLLRSSESTAPSPEPSPFLSPVPNTEIPASPLPQKSVDGGSDFSLMDQEFSPRNWSPPPILLDEDQKEPSITWTVKLDTYSSKRRELLDILSSLHSTGIQQDLDLPQICVIGSQSVGKSSLIESMSGIKLPRDSGTCTRCPTECRLQNSPSWSCKIVLRFHTDAFGKPLGSPRDIPFGSVILEQDKDIVEHMLRRAQLAVLHPTMETKAFLDKSEPDMAGHIAQTFSHNCVCIRVAGPDVPDLYFYDLPGIIANVADGGNEDDIKLVEALARSFIDRSNCIILLVISCETDFENQGAGRLVLRKMGLRNRTIGVLTKVDRIEPGGEDKWIRIMRNQENPLPNGWFCVKQPDLPQLRSGISWDDAKAAERTFFDEAPIWSQLDRRTRGRLGSPPLAEQLGKILAELVAQKLPIIDTDIARQLRFVETELAYLPTPNLADPKAEALNLFRDFERQLAKHMQGLPDIVDANEMTSGLLYDINNTFERFRDDIRKSSPRFFAWSSKAKLSRDIFAGLLAPTQDDELFGEPSNTGGWHLDQVMELAKRCRTKELPGNYPFDVKQKFIAKALENWEAMAIRCFEEIHDLISDHVIKLVRFHFRKQALGGLQDTVVAVAAERIRYRFQATLDKIKSLCANERTPYTLNDHYFFESRTKFLGHYKAVYRQSRGHKALLAALQGHDSETRTVHDQRWQDINDAMAALARLGIPGLKPADLARLLPEDEMTPGLEIMAEVKAYFKVAYKRFVDNIPQQIDSDFIQGLDVDLGRALASMVLDEEQCAAWLQENPDEVLRREELIGKKKRLELAKDQINKVVRTSKAK
ncbi:hypothetical protein FRB94_010066 [Tulasnella sp. JGI-2019a]|nr:hypothetical protein FRB94_010066 [Tulasnella sp. JGI-2019a]